MSVVDVWVLGVDALARDGVLAAYDGLLSPDERARRDGFRHDTDRRAYVAAHGLVRTALSRRSPATAPADWLFRTTSHGRPDVDGDGPAARLRFNVAHTRAAVACVVADTVDCGVDVEDVTRPADVDLLARGTLTPDERRAVTTAPAHETNVEFFRHWTLKEAYAKARGLGMSVPFDRCGFALDGDAIRLVPHPSLDDDVAAWRFEQWRQGTVVVAVAVRAEDGDPHEIVLHGEPP
ncbi:MAG: 4'-phosphopantetheinyl transferase superfamily protein [Streptosporangiales bacterium]|nr:4'-phosphopantetheinyl transferase superfamily protein [Streptosporangiales bacterium]